MNLADPEIYDHEAADRRVACFNQGPSSPAVIEGIGETEDAAEAGGGLPVACRDEPSG